MYIYENMTDDELVILYCKENEAKAFDELLDRHKTYIFNVIYYKVKSIAIAEDLFQETFIKAINSLQKSNYTPSGKFKGWIARIANNLAIDYLRQEKHAIHLSKDDENYQLLLDNLNFGDQTIEDILINKQIKSDLTHLIKKLPEIQQEVIFLRYYKNLSFKEISELTHVSINTALGRMRYALINLKKKIDAYSLDLIS